MSAHMEGREENLPTGTQIQILRVSGPLDEAPESASCWQPFLSLALFALGGTDLTGGGFLRILSFVGPSTIMGPVWDRLPYPVLS
jgi:hypothetical protein